MDASAAEADADLTIEVVTSRGRGTFTFDKTIKVSEVIQHVRDHFDLTGQGTFELIPEDGDEPLKKERPLVSFGIEDGDVFVLTSGGKNV